MNQEKFGVRRLRRRCGLNMGGKQETIKSRSALTYCSKQTHIAASERCVFDCEYCSFPLPKGILRARRDKEYNRRDSKEIKA